MYKLNIELVSGIAIIASNIHLGSSNVKFY